MRTAATDRERNTCFGSPHDARGKQKADKGEAMIWPRTFPGFPSSRRGTPWVDDDGRRVKKQYQDSGSLFVLIRNAQQSQSEQTRRTCTSSFVLLFSAKAFAFRHRYDYNNPSWALDAFSLSTRSSKFVTSQAGLLTRHLLFDWTTRADGLTNTARQC